MELWVMDEVGLEVGGEREEGLIKVVDNFIFLVTDDERDMRDIEG